MNVMQPDAWFMMLLAWGVIAGCTFYCFYKLMISERDLSSDE